MMKTTAVAAVLAILCATSVPVEAETPPCDKAMATCMAVVSGVVLVGLWCRGAARIMCHVHGCVQKIDTGRTVRLQYSLAGVFCGAWQASTRLISRSRAVRPVRHCGVLQQLDMRHETHGQMRVFRELQRLHKVRR
jgi:hypothetical protein